MIQSYRNFWLLCLSFLSSFFLYGLTNASVPSEMIYEGRMLSQSGEVLKGDYVLRFSFWENSDFTEDDIVESGDIDLSKDDFSGWFEVIPVKFDSNGYFSVVLGRTHSLENLSFESYKYLQIDLKNLLDESPRYQLIDVNGDAGLDEKDRKFVGSVPYARHADTAEKSSSSQFIIQKSNNSDSFLSFGLDLSHFLQFDFDFQKFIFSDDVEIRGKLFLRSDTGSAEISGEFLSEKRVIRFPDADIVVVGESSIQVLTNKTLDGTKNTFLNISPDAILAKTETLFIAPEYPSSGFTTDEVRKFLSLYLEKDSSGKLWYKLTTQRDSLQKGVFTTQLSLPRFQSVSGKSVFVSVRNLQENSEKNKIDFFLLNEDGDIISSSSELFEKNGKTGVSLSFPENFIPDRETIFLEISAEITHNNPLFLGEIQIEYLSQ